MNNARKRQDAEFFKAIRDRETAGEEQETDGQADATSAHELAKFPAFALSPFVEVVADRVLDCLGALGRWSGGEVDQQFQLMIWRQFARPAHDEFFRISIEIAVNERRRVQRVEKLRKFAQAKTDGFWVLARGVRWGHDFSLMLPGWTSTAGRGTSEIRHGLLLASEERCRWHFTLFPRWKRIRRAVSVKRKRVNVSQAGPQRTHRESTGARVAKIVAQFTDVLVLLLIAAAVISAVIGWFERGSTLPYEALAIFASSCSMP